MIVGIGGIILRHKTDEMIDKALTGTLNRYNTENNTEITKMWDTVQEKVKSDFIIIFYYLSNL